jgi:hypothetical protein
LTRQDRARLDWTRKLKLTCATESSLAESGVAEEHLQQARNGDITKLHVLREYCFEEVIIQQIHGKRSKIDLIISDK